MTDHADDLDAAIRNVEALIKLPRFRSDIPAHERDLALLQELKHRREVDPEGPRVAPTNDTVSGWIPMSDPTDIKHIGKLLEELGENVSAGARCLIQGIDETEPTTGKPNRQWLQEEIADVLANLHLVSLRFHLDVEKIEARQSRKMGLLRRWHAMIVGDR